MKVRMWPFSDEEKSYPSPLSTGLELIWGSSEPVRKDELRTGKLRPKHPTSPVSPTQSLNLRTIKTTEKEQSPEIVSKIGAVLGPDSNPADP